MSGEGITSDQPLFGWMGEHLDRHRDRMLISGALAAWAAQGVWQLITIDRSGRIDNVETADRSHSGDFLSFVCSIGNVPLAAVLWNGGISFGGVAPSYSPI